MSSYTPLGQGMPGKVAKRALRTCEPDWLTSYDEAIDLPR